MWLAKLIHNCKSHGIEHSSRMIKVANCEYTSRGFESMQVSLVNCVRALNKFSLNLYVPVYLADLMSTSLAGWIMPKDQWSAHKLTA